MTSADRLYKILKSLLDENSNANTTTSAYALRNAFGIQGNIDRQRLMKYYNSTIKLVQNLKNICESIGGRMAKEFVLNLDIIEEALLSIGYSSSHKDLSTFASLLNSGIAMAGLKNIAAYIDDNDLEKDVEDKELEQIQCELESLISTIENATIDAGFQRMLISNLRDLTRDIQEYKLFGTANISHMLQKTAGQALLHSQRIEPSQENIGIFNQVLSKMRDFNTIISFSTTWFHAIPVIASATTVLGSC